MGVDKLKLAEALSAFLIREAGQASSGRLKEAVPRDVANGPLVEARAIRRNRMDDDGRWMACRLSACGAEVFGFVCEGSTRARC